MGCNASQQAVVPTTNRNHSSTNGTGSAGMKGRVCLPTWHRLEKAYTDFKAGRGPTFPIISIGDDGDTVSLKAMQQISKTGIKRNVVRETMGPDCAAVWYYGSPKRCAGDEVAFDGECDWLEGAYAAFQNGGAATINIDEGGEVLSHQRWLHHDNGRAARAVVAVPAREI